MSHSHRLLLLTLAEAPGSGFLFVGVPGTPELGKSQQILINLIQENLKAFGEITRHSEGWAEQGGRRALYARQKCLAMSWLHHGHSWARRCIVALCGESTPPLPRALRATEAMSTNSRSPPHDAPSSTACPFTPFYFGRYRGCRYEIESACPLGPPPHAVQEGNREKGRWKSGIPHAMTHPPATLSLSRPPRFPGIFEILYLF